MANNVQKLCHIQLTGIVPYAAASRVQEAIVSRFLAAKASTTTAPLPHIITANFRPVYTTGRREAGKSSTEYETHLRTDGRADFVEAARGGQVTFHGPGQLVAYPILNLRTHNLSPKSYVCLLEKSLIATCARFGIKTMTTEHTGVWTSHQDKIAAIGVHMRRHITSHGVALNVNTDLWWFDRIIACGLEGKRTTSMEKEGCKGLTVEGVGDVFVEEVASRLAGVEGIEKVKEELAEEMLTADA